MWYNKYVTSNLKQKEGNNMKVYNTSDFGGLPTCWLFVQGKYKLCKFNNPEFVQLDDFPKLSRNYKEILDELGIPYEEVSDCEIRFWDPNVGKGKDVTLPLYILYNEEYRYTGKEFTGMVPTSAAINAARSLITQIAMFYGEKQQHDFIQRMKNLLRGRTAIGFRPTNNLEISEEGKNFSNGIDNLFLLPVMNDTASGRKETGWYAVFDVNKIKLDTSRIILEVPKGHGGKFIGKGAWQVRSWSYKLGVSVIRVAEV